MITEEGESTVRCCLSNIRLLLVTVNAERASEIEKVSTVNFYSKVTGIIPQMFLTLQKHSKNVYSNFSLPTLHSV